MGFEFLKLTVTVPSPLVPHRPGSLTVQWFTNWPLIVTRWVQLNRASALVAITASTTAASSTARRMRGLSHTPGALSGSSNGEVPQGRHAGGRAAREPDRRSARGGA